MGFRYAGIKGVKPEDVEVEAVALYSDVAHAGAFHCSNELLNQLQSNITWSAKSNFVDIPTDCPQRDERMGWTGDINVFAPTALYNFELSRFLEKWLRDVKAEQRPGGGIPNTVPVQGYGFPATMPEMAVDWWGDACVNGAVGALRGDRQRRHSANDVPHNAEICQGLPLLGRVRHRKAPLYLAHAVCPALWRLGRARCAQDEPVAGAQQIHRHGQPFLHQQPVGCDCTHPRQRSGRRPLHGFEPQGGRCLLQRIYGRGSGRVKDEFQTAYVLPLYLNIFPENVRAKAAENLVQLVEKNDYKIGTGFPGTPYILFALADSGHADTAFKMLLNTQCPGWLYEVRVGATTVWERWDGLDENGECPISNDGTDQMISYNHYASGAVGAFLYRRVLGVEPLEAGYKRFRFAPLIGGGLTEADGTVDTPYGKIHAEWQLANGVITARVTVPMGTACSVLLPGAGELTLGSGTHEVRGSL